MKKFSFSFQYLLDAHSAKEQAAEHALHSAIKQLNEAEVAQRNMVKVRDRKVHALEEVSGVVNRFSYALSMRNMEVVYRHLAELEAEVEQCVKYVDECREKLRQEMVARRVLENLCERERTEWADALQSEEQKLMDELAIGRWGRLEQTK